MNQTVKKPYFILFLTAVVLTVAAVIFRAVLVLTQYNATLGQFKPGLASELLFPLLLTVALVFFLLCGCFLRGKAKGISPKHDIPTFFAGAFAAFCTIAWCVMSALSFLRRPDNTLTMLVLEILTFLCAIGLAVYLISHMLPAASPALRLASGAAAVIFCIFYIFLAYFDTTFTLNSPIKIFDQITVLALMFFLLSECRFMLGKPRPAFFIPVGFAAMFFSASNALPGLIYTAVRGTPLLGSVLHDFLLFALCLYITARMVSLMAEEKTVVQADPYAAAPGETDIPHMIPDTHITHRDPMQQVIDIPTGEEPKKPIPPSEIAPGPSPRDFATEAHTTVDFEKKKH